MANALMRAAELARPVQRRGGGMRASFGGASTGRHFQDWMPWTHSPDFETKHVLRFLRARARQLSRDDPYASGFLTALSDNVVGPEGRQLQAKVKTSTGKLVETTNREIERGWRAWGYQENASADGVDSWVDIQRLRIEAIGRDGEVFIRRLRGFGNPFGYAVQFIDPDLVDELYNVPPGPGQNEIRMGIELDRYSRRVAFHVWNRYETEFNGVPRERERIVASDMIHDFVRYRPNQIRGITWFAPVLTRLYRLDRYEGFSLAAAEIGAAKMGFIKNVQAAAVEAWDWSKQDEPKVMDVEAGLIAELLPGQEFQSFDPNHPATTHEMFMSVTLRSVARGLNVSTLTLTGNAKEFNFSSMRGALIPERDHWRALQRFEVMHFDRIVYTDWLQMALVNGAVRLDSRLASNYQDVVFKGRGWQHVQPREEIEAIEKRLKLGLTSRSREAAEIGGDYEEIVEEQEHEQEFADEHDVDVSGSETKALPPGASAPDFASPDTGDDTETTDKTNAGGQSPRLVALSGGA